MEGYVCQPGVALVPGQLVLVNALYSLVTGSAWREQLAAPLQWHQHR